MSKLDPSLQESFRTLKQCAKSDADVTQWFQNNPQCLPGIPEILVPYLKVEKQTFGQFRPSTDGCPERRFSLEYRASLEDACTIGDFLEVTGISATYQKRPSYITKEILLNLSPYEWPYVAMLAAKEVLDLDLASESKFAHHGKAAWDALNTGTSWDVLKQLYINGLLPNDEEAFVNWASTLSNQIQASVSLPHDMGAA